MLRGIIWRAGVVMMVIVWGGWMIEAVKWWIDEDRTQALAQYESIRWQGIEDSVVVRVVERWDWWDGRGFWVENDRAWEQELVGIEEIMGIEYGDGVLQLEVKQTDGRKGVREIRVQLQ